jgi:hypothetical protein
VLSKVHRQCAGLCLRSCEFYLYFKLCVGMCQEQQKALQGLPNVSALLISMDN